MRWIAVSFKPGSKSQEAPAHFDADALYAIVAKYSPTIAWREDAHHAHAGWLVEVHSSFRLFGGSASLLASLWRELEELPNGLQIANYPTATGAWWLSKFAPARSETAFLDMLELDENQLLALPVAVLDCDSKLQLTWQQCGLLQLRDLHALPRDSFLRRFGPLPLAELDSGLGKQNRLAPSTPAYTPDETFEQERELPFHSNRLDLIEHQAQILIEAACKWLALQQRGTREMVWTFRQANTQKELNLRSAQATPCEATWKQLLHHKLSRMQFKDDIRSLKLQCNQTEALPHANQSFLPDPMQGNRNWNSTCDVLRARLGEETILFATTESDPRPECSIVLQHKPAAESNSSVAQKVSARHAPELDRTRLGSSTPRPLWLLPTPQALQGKPPAWHVGGPWLLLTGPERVEFGWWDSQPCKRDYYCARDNNSSLVWIYQDLLNDKRPWFLHGYFA